MTKAEALAKIDQIEGMTGSRAIALVDALDALGLLNFAITGTAQQSGVQIPITKPLAGDFRTIKDALGHSQRATPAETEQLKQE